MTEYNIKLRNPRTLALLGEMPRYKSVQWWRRPVLAGKFSVAVHKDDIAAAVIPRLAVLEILRDNEFEFAGICENREYNAITQMWTLSGRDLKGFFLSGRQVHPGDAEFDAQLGVVAETAMKHYVQDHLTAAGDVDPDWGSRDINTELDGITFTCEGTHGWGATVYKNARWENLLAVLAELALAGDLTHDVVMKANYTGYEYQVSQPVDATEEGGGTPAIFSVSLDNVGEAVYVEQYTNLMNVCYVLGSGAGAARNLRYTEDEPSTINDLRREGHLDARQAEDDTDRLDMAGYGAIDKTLLAALTARMAPLNLEPTLYRREWDIGYDVTVDFNTIGEQVDRRIEEVHCVLEATDRR